MGKFLYETIKDYLKKLIQENKNVPNYKLPSENQLAMRFSTTRMTAKRAISELQEEGLLYRIHGKGSFITAAPAQGTDVPVNEFICMLLPNLESHFILELIAGARQYLKPFGYHLLIMSESEEELRTFNLIKRIVNLNIKGIIVFPNSRAHYNKDLLLLALNKFPVVFVDRTLHDFDISSETSDHINIGRRGIQVLIDKGCQNIGFISMPREDSSSISRRLTGYEKAHVENDRRIIPRHILYVTKNDPNQTEQITRFLTENPQLDGLLSYGGKVGFNVYKAIAKSGRKVPEELKVIFLDDEYADYCDLLPFSPTCIAQNSFEIGSRAAELIINYITTNTITSDKIQLDCNIIERESTGKGQ